MPVTTTDGDIQAARSRLNRAIAALIDPQPRPRYLEDGRVVNEWLDPIYHQLRVSTGGQNVAEKGDSRKSRLPIWVDAVDLLTQIDATVILWSRISPLTDLPPTRTWPTVARLQALDRATYRPQDTAQVMRWTTMVREWVGKINHLLDPESVKHISAPCPACGQATIYRRDASGEVVRQPALQLVTNQGCTCLACKTHWEPTKYLFLCKLLGFDLPEGVLE